MFQLDVDPPLLWFGLTSFLSLLGVCLRCNFWCLLVRILGCRLLVFDGDEVCFLRRSVSNVGDF